MSDIREKVKKVRGIFLVSTAAVLCMGVVLLAAPATLHRTSKAESVERSAVAPSVIIGAGTERTPETDALADAKGAGITIPGASSGETQDHTAADMKEEAAGKVEETGKEEAAGKVEETGKEEAAGKEDETEDRAKIQTSLWLSSMAEGLDKVKPVTARTEPVDSSSGEALMIASEIGEAAKQLVTENQEMSYSDYQTLLAIVEAECTGGDEKSKLLVADVILNRVKDDHFPDNIHDVVYQKLSGQAQFSPVADGRMGTLKVEDNTISAVKRAIAGEDISEGALFFMARKYSDEENVEWFDQTLTYLYSYGGHDFYKFKE